MYLPRGIEQPDQLAAAIADAEQMLGSDVVRLRYTVRENWSNEPAIYFKVVLTDEAAKHRLREVTSRVRDLLEEHVDPANVWGLMSYYNFRSQSEQETLKEPAWA